MEIPHQRDVQIYSVSLRNDVFLNHYSPKRYEFLTLLHYPNQLLRSIGSMKYKWTEKTENASTDISFRVEDLEVMQRRNKPNNPCNEYWDHHDNHILVKHVNDVGCRAPYQFPTKSIRKCTTREEMNKSPFYLRADDYGSHPPCQSMDKIVFTYEEHDLSEFSWAKKGHTWIGINLFIDHFKKIEQTRYRED